MFLDVTSNGVATQTTFKKALLGSLYELFERDGLLMYWLNGLVPDVIDMKTCEDESIQKRITQLENRDLALHVLDCKTEYGVPILVIVAIDTKRGGVCVNAAAGFNIEENIHKLIHDTANWDIEYNHAEIQVAPHKLHTMHQRSVMWRGKDMRDEIAFFLKGTVKTYAEYKKQFTDPGGEDQQLEFFKQQFKKQGTQVVYFEYSHPLASDAGLSVVRTIIPDFIPMYFVESKKAIRVKRLYTFAQKMGFKNAPITKEELYTVPHPFI